MKFSFNFFLVLSLSTSISVAQNFWEYKGLEGMAIYDITVDSDGNIYAASPDSGVYLSTNNGNSWQQRNTGLTSFNVWSIKALSNPSGLILAGTQDMGLFKSTDLGNTWNTSGLSEWVSEIASKSNGDIFASTISDGIYRSTDDGSSWERVSDPMQVGNDVYSINVNTNEDVFAGTDSYMFRSTDAGNTWDKIDTGIVVTGVIWSIAFNLSGDVFVGDGAGFFVGPGSVYRSSNNGNSWSQTSMTNRSVNALTTIPGSTIYAGTDNGVYVSYDNSNSGEQINSGLTESLIYSLSLDKAGYLFAGTNNGIFRSVESVTSIDEKLENLPLNFTLNQNYPNPFNPSTTINFSIPETSFITLEVFNALGERVGVLAYDELSAGTYKHNWNAAELTSGVYFYRLQAGNFVETKKMILLR